MPGVDLAQIELRSHVLWRIFLVDGRGRRPAEHVLVREFESLERDREILVVEILVPQFPQLILSQFLVSNARMLWVPLFGVPGLRPPSFA